MRESAHKTRQGKAKNRNHILPFIARRVNSQCPAFGKRHKTGAVCIVKSVSHALRRRHRRGRRKHIANNAQR